MGSCGNNSTIQHSCVDPLLKKLHLQGVLVIGVAQHKAIADERVGAAAANNLDAVLITRDIGASLLKYQSGVWLALKYELPLIKASGGAVVNTASVSGLRGEVCLAPCCAAKGGVIALGKSAAAEYAVVTGEDVSPFGDQCCQPRNEIHGFEGHLGRSIAAGRLEGIDYLARGAE